MRGGQPLVDDDDAPGAVLGRGGRLGKAMGQREALDAGQAGARQEGFAEGAPLRARRAARQLADQPLQALQPHRRARDGRRRGQFIEADGVGQHRLHEAARLRGRTHERQRDDTDGVDVLCSDAARQRVAVVPVDDLFGQALHDSSIFAQPREAQPREQRGELNPVASTARRSDP
ncbi:MAG: hypothetical protein GXC94_06845 [Comamonadaceae bacterium]|nr:hypothetical protein [Comamonadaceae bacterium]